jgi:hypothetical protein
LLVRHTGSGTQLARAALLRGSDLGRPWSEASAAPRRVPRLTCAQFAPALTAVTEIGTAATPTWQQSSAGPFFSQSSYVYARARQRADVWAALARPHLLSCVADALLAGSGNGVHYSVKHKQLLPLPALSASAAGYRVRGTASASGQTIDVYLDVVLLGRGSQVTEISFSTFEQPVARRLELRLARAAASRLGG